MDGRRLLGGETGECGDCVFVVPDLPFIVRMSHQPAQLECREHGTQFIHGQVRRGAQHRHGKRYLCNREEQHDRPLTLAQALDALLHRAS